MSTSTGNEAESRAADYLQKHGYKIIERNWRTRYCEIDIVAEKQKVVWLVEVKYRSSTSQGYGYEYITPKKLQQMQFATEIWVQNNNWSGDYRLAVISIDGNQVQFIDNVA